ncbi:hypothetical protein [Furfurilactobacillus siliginis]|uniref:Uncharacterized protein n=1 Tax=Furfurilactobacillus siliginis TaxID=348151 RepID=A0A0R2L5G9_9LACO|nr:hypothetical protein [Furfurilactobacillus siliginis]KRN97016.1 hypothetical protein IV55_GL000893 [Furfurilactobacillus siliginis]GEK27776.1 hypothetical protein LSI01_00870 [Furfurilactobacillus siliginis]
MTTNQPNDAWLDELGELVEDGQLHFYTRLTLLLISKGYTPAEFLAPGFKTTFATIHWLPFERQFIQAFRRHQAALDQQVDCQDPFLKPVIASPHLSIAELQDVLDSDTQRIGFSLQLNELQEAYEKKV